MTVKEAQDYITKIGEQIISQKDRLDPFSDIFCAFIFVNKNKRAKGMRVSFAIKSSEIESGIEGAVRNSVDWARCAILESCKKRSNRERLKNCIPTDLFAQFPKVIR